MERRGKRNPGRNARNGNHSGHGDAGEGMINVLSLGAGVQSSAMALMAAKGEITPMPDCAIFADTQAEPQSTTIWIG